jgi:hypothetical protein
MALRTGTDNVTRTMLLSAEETASASLRYRRCLQNQASMPGRLTTWQPSPALHGSAGLAVTLLLTRKGCAQIQETMTVRLRLSRENSQTPVLSTGTSETGPWAKRTQQNVSVGCKIVSVNTPAQVDSTLGKTVKHFFVLKEPAVDNNGAGISEDI